MAVPGDIDLRPGQIYHQPQKSGNKKVIYCTDFAHVEIRLRSERSACDNGFNSSPLLRT